MKKVFKILTISVMLVLCLTLTSCSSYASVEKLSGISLMITKKDANYRLGVNGTARGSMINKSGKVIDVVEYKIDEGRSRDQIIEEITLIFLTCGLALPILFISGTIGTYWFYFCENKLIQWGRAGDWAEAERVIYDISIKGRLA